ncbi:hypothetical protein ZWY2020_052831 [Hordeum vulgare]|nr:hypothetical protein ZWY2020_052831 [Hordeum vulgare]
MAGFLQRHVLRPSAARRSLLPPRRRRRITSSTSPSAAVSSGRPAAYSDPRRRRRHLTGIASSSSPAWSASSSTMAFYLPLRQGQSCVKMNMGIGVAVTAVRTVADLFYLAHMILQSSRTAFVAPSSRVFGRSELVNPDQIAIRYLKNDFIIDLAAMLPIPRHASAPPSSSLSSLSNQQYGHIHNDALPFQIWQSVHLSCSSHALKFRYVISV